jgi:ABC-2 type transport system permease protein
MLKVLATIRKELLQLCRDRAGLLLLFAMPCALVLVISLIQDNILKATADLGVSVLVLNHDEGELGEKLVGRLEQVKSFQSAIRVAGRELSDAEGRKAVADGHCQFCIIIPPGMSEWVSGEARRLAQASLAKDGQVPASGGTNTASENAARLRVFFDPTIQGSVRASVTASLEKAALLTELEERAAIFASILPEQVSTALSESIGEDTGVTVADLRAAMPEIRLDWIQTATLGIREETAMSRFPTAVQHNVPAWSLFGMFFIVVPLASALILERQQGTLNRLRAMPVSLAQVLAGKVVAYVLICLVQFLLMLLLGILVLPLLGTARLEVGTAVGAIAALVVASALAATGFGLMIGALARTHEQASMLGALSVVIAAAIGGIMIPVYVMPPAMRVISQYSPIAWGHQGLLDVFVKGASLPDVLPNVLLLAAFFGVTLAIACVSLRGRNLTAG